jgi:hypothetical protein
MASNLADICVVPDAEAHHYLFLDFDARPAFRPRGDGQLIHQPFRPGQILTEAAASREVVAQGERDIGDPRAFGWILVMEGETVRGLNLLRGARARSSRNAGISYHLAVALNSLGHTAEARHEFDTIIEAAPATEIGEKARALLSSLPSAEE